MHQAIVRLRRLVTNMNQWILWSILTYFSDTFLSSSPPSATAFGAGNGIQPTVEIFTKLVKKYIWFACHGSKIPLPSLCSQCNLVKIISFAKTHLLDFYSRVSCVCAPIPTPAKILHSSYKHTSRFMKYLAHLPLLQGLMWEWLCFAGGFAPFWAAALPFLDSIFYQTPLPGFLAHFLSNF